MLAAIYKLFRRVDKRPDQAVLIHLSDGSLARFEDVIGAIAELEDELSEALGSTGDCDGHDIGTGKADATIYLYGPNGEDIYEKVRVVLENNRLSENCRVVIRRGGPGAAEREVQLQRYRA
jgi:hypothetical protein